MADGSVLRAGLTPEQPRGRRYLMALAHVQQQLFIGDVGLEPPERTEEFAMLFVTKMLGLMLLSAFFAALASKMISDQRASSRLYKEKVRHAHGQRAYVYVCVCVMRLA